MISITPVYAVLLSAIFLTLSVRVILMRRGQKIAYGAGDDTDNVALLRAQKNFAEYVPLALLLLVFAELQGVSAVWLHLSGFILLIGRMLHGYGMGFNRKFFAGRVGGTVCTLTALILLMVMNLVAAL